MWRTEQGERVLESPEAKLFSFSLLDILGNVISDEDEIFETEVGLFDRLTVGQKVSALSIVANGLLSKDVACVKLTAVLEATVAVVYDYIKRNLTLECDEPESSTQWRTLVVKAIEFEVVGVPHNFDEVDLDEWCDEVDSLRDGVLWDEDYKLEENIADQSPDDSKRMKKNAGIHPDYFTDVIDDIKDDEIETTCKALNELCGRFL